jgi:hypothetical protein
VLFRKATKENDAFTRIELLFSIFSAILLGFVIFSGSASATGRNQRLTCLDNLRQIGQAVQLWAFEHQDAAPWNLPVGQGGTRPIPGMSKPGNPAREFGTLSNELGTPKILLCPNDDRRGAQAAENWTSSPNGGYLNGSYANNATSYSIGLHANFTSPLSVLSLDRSLRLDFTGLICPLGVNNAVGVSWSPLSSAAWTNVTHGRVGNFLLMDGRVMEVPNSRIQQAFFGWVTDDINNVHFLAP